MLTFRARPRSGLKVQILPDAEMRRAERTSLNRLIDISDWRIGGPLPDIMFDLREGVYIHRKAWEYAMCIHGERTLKAVGPESQILGVAAGYERPLYHYANIASRVVATDLYDNPSNEAKPDMITHPERYAPFEYRRDRLEVHRMDALDLQFADASFDFVFCLSSVEHFGSRENSKQGMREMYRVTKPGGYCCIATELILNKATHEEYFTLPELEDTILRSTPFQMVGGELDLRISRSLVENPIDVTSPSEVAASPHIVMGNAGVVWTSVVMFFRKE